MSETKKQNYLKGAAILAATGILTKIITAVYKIPVLNLLGDTGAGHFQIALNLYTLLLTISTAGIPVALSRLVSAASSTGRDRLVKRYFSVALPFFALLGLVLTLIMLIFADPLASFMGDVQGGLGIQVLAPAVFFSCVISIYRGYFQGHNNMIPTAVSQLMEALSKFIIGLLIVWLLIQAGYDSSVATAGSYVGSTIGLGLCIPVLIFLKFRFDKRSAHHRLPVHDRETAGRGAVLLQIFKVSIPITLGSSILNIMTFADTKIVMSRLQDGAHFTYEQALALYGVYTKGLSVFNFPSSLIVPVAVSIVPVIAAAIATGRHREAKGIMESSLKLTNLIAMPAGVGMAILSVPIFKVLYWNSNPIGPALLATFGIASYFMCAQLVTIGILQATGHEKIPLVTCTVGGLFQIALDAYLTGQPDINIMGSPFGTLICYGAITILNLMFINFKVSERPELSKVFVKPALCTAVMGVAAWAVYELLFKAGAETLGDGRLALAVYLFGAIAAAVLVYGILVIATKTVTRDDMRLIPRGERIANFLKIK
ncbi:stage V sporulation protein B [Sporobacter termitidis DSM 10068]|uniref:Stage V sporulation protein B n=1 Tax=Sporobacter termitidis DSM 10068 TaxID=1123282 RepID=A0A1M5VNZ1_9FIRM|nr:polysaccharide biosynthesis protein [Sporobacter termitidis]SHH76724.1 stage V sporulation protein B [Sporobacter termitidis DSM 10068]